MFHPPNFYKRKNQLFIAQSRHTLSANDMHPRNEPKTSKVREVLSEFCARSTIHGVVYIADRKKHRIERVCWIIALIVSICACGYSIQDTWLKWRRNQIVLDFENKAIVYGLVPFPAVSICPKIKSSVDKFNYTKVYHAMLKSYGDQSQNATSEESRFMYVASQLCENRVASQIIGLFSNNYTDNSILSAIIEMAPKFEDTIVDCEWIDSSRNCSNIFSPIITEIGLCYTFNLLNLDDLLTDQTATDFFNATLKPPLSTWSPENDDYYAMKTNEEELYPFHTFGTGLQNSLVVILRIDRNDMDPLCSGGVHGFNVMLHPPNERPDVSNKFFHLSPGKSLSLSAEPKTTVTSDDVRARRPEDRGCFFDSERKLRYYKQYTQRNCEIECLSIFTLRHCGCVRYSFPRTSDMKICGPAEMKCLDEVDGDIFRYRNRSTCNCPISCAKLSYAAHTSQADFDLVKAVTAREIHHGFDMNSSVYSRLIVSFRDEHFTPTKRAASYSVSELIANCGGLFGLFMGASVLSIIEMIYYFTVRMYFAFNEDKDATSNRDNHISFVPFVPRNPVRQSTPEPTHSFRFLP